MDGFTILTLIVLALMALGITGLLMLPSILKRKWIRHLQDLEDKKRKTE